jgi:hypothetical protein
MFTTFSKNASTCTLYSRKGSIYRVKNQSFHRKGGIYGGEIQSLHRKGGIYGGEIQSLHRKGQGDMESSL